MKQDPFVALEGYYAAQERRTSRKFERQVSGLLEDEMRGTDFTPVVSGLRKGLPLAAAMILCVLTPSVSQKDVRKLSSEIEQAQASSVQAELEIPWQD